MKMESKELTNGNIKGIELTFTKEDCIKNNINSKEKMEELFKNKLTGKFLEVFEGNKEGKVTWINGRTKINDGPIEGMTLVVEYKN